MAPSLGHADSLAKQLAELPEVSRTLTLSSFIPGEQDKKIALLRGASRTLNRVINPRDKLPAPSDQDNVAAIRNAAQALKKAAGDTHGPGADVARNVSSLLDRLGDADTDMRRKAEAALVRPLTYDLDRLRKSLPPEAVTLKTLPENLVRDWMLPDGRARVQAIPKGDPNATDVLRRFAQAVLRVSPGATGSAIS